MKKIILFLAAIAMVGLTACESCKSNNEQKLGATDYDGVVQDFTAGVAHIQALHRQTMFGLVQNGKSVTGGYEWRNSNVLFNDSIKMETIDDLHVTNVTDVFYYWNKEKGPQVQYITTDVKKGTLIPPAINDVWIEDADMSEKEIKLNAEDVLKRLKEWNGIIPPANGRSLRYPVGPCECNAQWVIGDVYDVIFIDAVTGEISNWNPAFNPTKGVKGGDFGKPLGEWP